MDYKLNHLIVKSLIPGDWYGTGYRQNISIKYKHILSLLSD